MKERLEAIQKDLTNSEVVMRILESGTSEELEQYREFHGLTAEQVELFSYYAKLRKTVHEEMRQELEERKEGDLEADQEELDMGAYRENIEPQVREVILEMRRKGYATYISGFNGENRQKISFEKKYLEDFELPEQSALNLKAEGVDVKIKPNSITLFLNKQLELDKIEKIWQEIEKALPDLGAPAEPCKLRAAEFFRKKQKTP